MRRPRAKERRATRREGVCKVVEVVQRYVLCLRRTHAQQGQYTRGETKTRTGSTAYLLAVESSRQYPDAIHLAPVLQTEVELPVERHDGSDLFGGCPSSAAR